MSQHQLITQPAQPMHTRPLTLRQVPEMRPSLPEAVAMLEKKMILEALARTVGHRTHAARVLGITNRQLLYKLRDLALESEEAMPLRGRPRQDSGRQTSVSVSVHVDVQTGGTEP